MIKESTRQAYSEVDEFIEMLDEENKNKILFKEEKDKSYKKEIKLDIDIENQDLKKETLAIIAFLNLEYLCSPKEKEELMNVYKQNENK